MLAAASREIIDWIGKWFSFGGDTTEHAECFEKSRWSQREYLALFGQNPEQTFPIKTAAKDTVSTP